MPVSEEDISLAQQALYENEALRENLDDDEAAALLKWGETCIALLGQAEGDFGQGCQAVRRVLAAVDKLVARADLEDGVAQQAIQRLVESAPSLGLSFSAQQVQDALPADSADRQGTLEALLALLDGGAPTSASEDEPPPPDASNPSNTPGERFNRVMGRLRGLLGGG
ncbi:MAG: hypothetical protein NZ750_08045 [Anaerolineae bacterium]|nr:hypothetical protein [Anaerolineae bacterium]MDW8172300.1 hypothetical protein [Anaerolineae bacterium]